MYSVVGFCGQPGMNDNGSEIAHKVDCASTMLSKVSKLNNTYINNHQCMSIQHTRHVESNHQMRVVKHESNLKTKHTQDIKRV